MKPFIFLLTILICAGLQGQTVTIGTGTSTTDIQPVQSYYIYNYTQQIYTSAEITAGGGVSGNVITAIRFYWNGAGSLANTDTWTVYLGNTATATYPNNTSWIAVGSMTQVYSGAVTLPGAAGWMTINLTTPYTWTGNNLVVAVDENVSNYAPTAATWRYTSTSANYRCINYYNDAVNPDPAAPPTGTRQYERPNIQLEFIAAVPMTYTSATTTQTNISDVGQGSLDQEIIGIRVVTSGVTSPLTAGNFSFNTTGTTNPAVDIRNARLWYTGTSSSFATTTQVGATIANPNGAFVINAARTLTTGTNYFWLTYDIPAGATINNWVDAECNSIIVGGIARTPTTQAPAGRRQIKNSCSSGLGTGFVNAAALPYNSGATTTCGMVNNLTSANTISCGSAVYFDEQDAVYSFTPASSGCVTIDLASNEMYSGMKLYSGCPLSGQGGTCVAFNQALSDNKSMIVYVTAGVTYYLILDSWTEVAPYCFDYTLNISAPSAGPINDEPCNAIFLNPTDICQFTTYSNQCSSNSSIANPGCASYSGSDVWFRTTVPTNGSIVINSVQGTMVDGGMAVYSGPNCSTLTLVECDADDSENGTMPKITLTGLTPGSTLWIRFWEQGNDNNGTFGICASKLNAQPSCATNPAAGDHCGTAVSICNLNGYCGNTSAAYDRDEPGNILPLWEGASIENNSWLKFVAEDDTVILNIWVSGCLNNLGIQMRIVGTPDCSNFTSFSNFWNPAVQTDGVIMATGLTPGQTYYLMIDGYAGDVCNYIIGAGSGSGVLVPSAGADQTVVPPGCVTLSASGGTSYLWSASPADPTLSAAEQTQQTINVCPTVQTTYSVTVTGGNPLCPASGVDNAVVFINVPVPVEYLSMSAKCDNGSVIINWATASETNCAYFSIEKMFDDGTFGELATVHGNGNSNIIHNYQVVDNSVDDKKNYYRIKQIDFDGQENYSPVFSAQCNENNSTTINAVQSGGYVIVEFGGVENESYLLTFVDVHGHDLYCEHYTAQKDEVVTLNIPVAGLSPAVYLIKVDGLEMHCVKKITIF